MTLLKPNSVLSRTPHHAMPCFARGVSRRTSLVHVGGGSALRDELCGRDD